MKPKKRKYLSNGITSSLLSFNLQIFQAAMKYDKLRVINKMEYGRRQRDHHHPDHEKGFFLIF